MTIKQKLEAFGLSKVLGYLETNPEENIPKVLNWLEKLDKTNLLTGQGNPLPTIKRVLQDENGVWFGFVKDILTNMDANVRKKLFTNFVVNSVIVGREKKLELVKKEGCNIPIDRPIHYILL